MRYELLVFDWDGTLMDSAARIVASMQAAFAELGLPPPAAAAARNVIGLGLTHAVAELAPTQDAAMRARIIERYRAHYLELDDTPTPLFPGAEEVVSGLRAAGYLLAVATGKSRIGLDRALAQSGLGAHFHATRSADETFSKPHPQMLQELLDELGVHASRALMIGDTEYDLLTAQNAGVDAVAVCYGVHTPERLLALEPRACLSAIDALPGWLAAADPHTSNHETP
ncbi:MAG: HAD-IA family hydrolase [Gammaproteobacteria bacterium]|nr:HAD-IA family hydrolase [Gammaproteobacteria bacterium]